MRVAIDRDEWYPVYSIQEHNLQEWEDRYEVPQEIIDEYWEAMTRFTDIQLKLRRIKETENELP